MSQGRYRFKATVDDIYLKLGRQALTRKTHRRYVVPPHQVVCLTDIMAKYPPITFEDVEIPMGKAFGRLGLSVGDEIEFDARPRGDRLLYPSKAVKCPKPNPSPSQVQTI